MKKLALVLLVVLPTILYSQDYSFETIMVEQGVKEMSNGVEKEEYKDKDYLYEGYDLDDLKRITFNCFEDPNGLNIEVTFIINNKEKILHLKETNVEFHDKGAVSIYTQGINKDEEIEFLIDPDDENLIVHVKKYNRKGEFKKGIIADYLCYISLN